MRIIKEDFRKVQPANFVVFPEEWLAAPPSLEAHDETHEGGNGKDAEQPVIIQQPTIDLAAYRAEADQIINDANAQADQIISGAHKQADTIQAQSQEQGQQIIAQASADGEAAKKEAYAAGFSGGEETGFKKGYEDGYFKGKAAALDEASRSLAMINKATQELENYRAQVLHEAQQDIVKMALAVAEKVLHKEIMTDPRTVVNVVKNAVSKVGFKRRFTISVNPLDIEVIESAGPEVSAMIDNLESIKFRPDPKIEPGGCIVQTESGTIDAQVDRQYAEIRDATIGAMQGKED
jgi:flagellar assembly protein FliH